MKIGYVYVIRCQDMVKIGWAQDPVARVNALRVGCPYPIQILFCLKKLFRKHERQLHQVFSDYHIRGEWFRFEGAVVDWSYQIMGGHIVCDVVFPELMGDDDE